MFLFSGFLTMTPFLLFLFVMRLLMTITIDKLLPPYALLLLCYFPLFILLNSTSVAIFKFSPPPPPNEYLFLA